MSADKGSTMSRVRRIAEEEYILVVLLAGFGLIFLLIFPPALVVNDSWLNLMAGREVVQNGLPSRDEITVYGLGATWTDQQWLAQVFMYGVHALGGFALLSLTTAASVVAAFSVASAAARSLGAGARAIWVMFLPVLVAAPWAWSIRAQMLALPLYTALLWLLATQARNPTRRIWLAFPILVVWANIHGSVALGALLVMLLGAYELIRSRGAAWPRSLALIVLAPLAVLATPYGPAATARYYHLLLVDPPFAGRVTEWTWSDPAVDTMFFYALAAIAIVLVWLGRKRLTVFDFAVLALTFAGGVNAIRGIVWFALACMVFVPVAIGRKLESKKPGEPRRGLNVAIATGLTVALVAVAASNFLRDEEWFEEYWPRDAVEAVREELEPDDRLFAPDRFSDWMLFKIPELRGRVSYDVRFELYDDAFYGRLQDYNFETGANWKSFADGYRLVLVDETTRSHTAEFLAEPGARAAYRDEEITLVVRERVDSAG
ncbi:MAG TPA: hypothetical protein VMK83_05705 [Gaiellaceae bacterium]|nr:hypothetical protein [Gaiellaceae bacterium]